MPPGFIFIRDNPCNFIVNTNKRCYTPSYYHLNNKKRGST